MVRALGGGASARCRRLPGSGGLMSTGRTLAPTGCAHVPGTPAHPSRSPVPSKEVCASHGEQMYCPRPVPRGRTQQRSLPTVFPASSRRWGQVCLKASQHQRFFPLLRRTKTPSRRWCHGEPSRLDLCHISGSPRPSVLRRCIRGQGPARVGRWIPDVLSTLVIHFLYTWQFER